MAASSGPSRTYLTAAAKDLSYADLPSESDALQDSVVKLEASGPFATGPQAHVFWKDVAPTPNQPPAPPAAIPRLKRSMMDSPFAGSASKRPFRRRDFESIPEDRSAEPPKEELSLPPLKEESINTDNLLLRLPSIPAVVTTSTYLQVSINPVIWRAQESPGGLMMNVGLAGVQLEGQHDLQLYLWSTMNPRIVTTGIPHPAASAESAERAAASAEVDSSEDESEGFTSRTRHGRAYNTQTAAGAPAAKKEKPNLILEEVFLVRKDPRRRIPDEVFHTSGPFEGGTVMCMPDWPGNIWSFDICCRVSVGTPEPIWVKSLDRPLQ